jgi:metal-sulfur cluster biosynthetic enzyme
MNDDDLAELIRDALRSVIDPELGHNIVDLGLVYAITVTDGVARIVMTATTPGCPAVGFLKDGAANRASRVPGVRSVDVVVTFDPPWTPSMIAADAKAALEFPNAHWNRRELAVAQGRCLGARLP